MFRTPTAAAVDPPRFLHGWQKKDAFLLEIGCRAAFVRLAARMAWRLASRYLIDCIVYSI